MAWYQLATVFLLFLAGLAESMKFPLIIGGQPAVLGQIPWQASLQVDGVHVCGGAIVSNTWVVSAAHCFTGEDETKLTVSVGLLTLSSPEGSQQVVRVSNFFIHNDYSPITDENDIAMVQLSSPLTFNRYVKAIQLPSANFDPQGLGVVSGWGTTRAIAGSDILRWVELPLMDDEECREYLGGLVKDSMLCAGFEDGGRDACSGDSGGPLTCEQGMQKILCGIVSRGLGCAQPDRPGIYTETSYFTEWIESTMAGSTL